MAKSSCCSWGNCWYCYNLHLHLLVVFEVVVDIPSTKALSNVRNPLASELFDGSGKPLGKYFIENRSPLEITDLNDFYKNTLIATEDIRFYKHNGVDTRSLFRVFFKTLLLQKDASGGGSTITQQLAKNLFPRKSYMVLSTMINKFREMAMAKRIEKIYTKDEILAYYSNTVSFGERAFGLHTASHRFFNKHPRDLLLEEAATLVGMLKATSYYNPRNYPDRARSRRNVVLGQLAKYDFISKETLTQLTDLPLVLNYQRPSDKGEKARYFKEQVRREFESWSIGTSKEDGSKYDLYKDGLKIYSTLDLDLQEEAERQMHRHMSDLQRLFLESWKGGNLYGKNNSVIDANITSDRLYKQLRAQGKNAKEALDYFIKAEERKLWTWDGMETRVTTKIDSIKHYLALLHTGIMAVKPGDGSILVWVGGNDFGTFQFDNINGARQVGSTFKPIVYLAALEKGSEPCDMYENELKTYADYDDWTPKNSNEKYGGKASLRGALTHSMNTVSVQVMFETGIGNVVDLAQRLGITSPLNEVPSLVLGTSDVSLYEMLGVYATFANRGKKIPLRSIKKITDHRDSILYEYLDNPRTEYVVDPTKVDVLNAMLLNVSVEGTANRIYKQFRIPYPICGKTGTTQNQSDGWYIGANADLAIGSWVGTQDRRIHFRNLGTGSGGNTALPMVGGLFQYASQKGYIKQKKIPMIATADCIDVIPSSDALKEEIVLLESSMEDLEKEIMGEYYHYYRRQHSKDRRSPGKRNKERDKRYREFKKAVKELEDKLAVLKDELKDAERIES